MHSAAHLRPPFAVALAVAMFVCSYAAADRIRERFYFSESRIR